MANRYSQNFTLNDIFGDKRLKGKVPLVAYKEGETPKGRLSQRTSVVSVGQLAYNNAVSSARPFYKPLIAHKSGNMISISGNTETSLTDIVDVVYAKMQGIKQMLIMTANDTDMIRSAVKEAGRRKAQGGVEPKLYLRVGSMQQIEQMGNRERNKLMQDIMRNLFFGNDFPETQKKFGVDKLFTQGKSYEQRKRDWLGETGQL